MDTAAAFALIERGLALIPTLIEVGARIEPIIESMIRVAKGGQEGTVTQEQLDALEAVLDADIAEFLKPLPPESV